MISILLIPGVMVGVELDYINKFFVVDLLIFRFVFDYAGEEEI